MQNIELCKDRIPSRWAHRTSEAIQWLKECEKSDHKVKQATRSRTFAKNQGFILSRGKRRLKLYNTWTLKSDHHTTKGLDLNVSVTTGSVF
jgi:hypothetical protein